MHLQNFFSNNFKNHLVAIAFIPLILSIGLGPILQSDLIPNADAAKSKGTSLLDTNSNKVCGLELCSAVGMQQPQPPQGQIIVPANDDPENQDHPVELLFVQTASSGTFIQKDGRNILTLAEISPGTIWFSDRPDRITGHMSTELFVAKWAEGNNNFEIDPPNGALEIFTESEGGVVIILELTNPVYSPESETLQYDVIILEESTEGLSHYAKDMSATIPSTFENAALFIDDASWSNRCVGFIQTDVRLHLNADNTMPNPGSDHWHRLSEIISDSSDAEKFPFIYNWGNMHPVHSFKMTYSPEGYNASVDFNVTCGPGFWNMGTSVLKASCDVTGQNTELFTCDAKGFTDTDFNDRRVQFTLTHDEKTVVHPK